MLMIIWVVSALRCLYDLSYTCLLVIVCMHFIGNTHLGIKSQSHVIGLQMFNFNRYCQLVFKP